jgi:hypothetical protein
VILFAVFVGLLVLSFALAWWKGGAPERIVASTFLTAWLASVALYASDANRYASIDWFGPAMNGVMAVILLEVARRANRGWPIVVASLQLLILLAQVGRSVRPNWIWQVYLLMTSVWPYLQLLVLLTGTIFHWRREILQGPVCSWSSSLKVQQTRT